MNNMAKISTTLLLIIVVAGSSITVLATQNKDDKMTSPLYDIRTTQAITSENQDIIMRHVGSDRSVSDLGFTINSQSGNYRSGDDHPDTVDASCQWTGHQSGCPFPSVDTYDCDDDPPAYDKRKWFPIDIPSPTFSAVGEHTPPWCL